MSQLWMYWDALQSAWSDWVLEYDFAHQVQLARAVQDRTRNAAFFLISSLDKRLASARRFWEGLRGPAGGAGSTPRLLVWAAMLIVIGLLATLAVRELLPLCKQAYHARRLRSGQGGPADCTFFYRRALRILERRGFARRELADTRGISALERGSGARQQPVGADHRSVQCGALRPRPGCRAALAASGAGSRAGATLTVHLGSPIGASRKMLMYFLLLEAGSITSFAMTYHFSSRFGTLVCPHAGRIASFPSFTGSASLLPLLCRHLDPIGETPRVGGLDLRGMRCTMGLDSGEKTMYSRIGTRTEAPGRRSVPKPIVAAAKAGVLRWSD